MEEAIETFSQSRSMFLLEALLRGDDSIEHTDPALKKCTKIKLVQRHTTWTQIFSAFIQPHSHLFDSAPPEITLSASVAKESVDPR